MTHSVLSKERMVVRTVSNRKDKWTVRTVVLLGRKATVCTVGCEDYYVQIDCEVCYIFREKKIGCEDYYIIRKERFAVRTTLVSGRKDGLQRLLYYKKGKMACGGVII